MMGEELRKARERAGLTQEQLSFRAGVSRPYVSQLERNLKSPTVATLFLICDASGSRQRMSSNALMPRGSGSPFRDGSLPYSITRRAPVHPELISQVADLDLTDGASASCSWRSHRTHQPVRGPTTRRRSGVEPADGRDRPVAAGEAFDMASTRCARWRSTTRSTRGTIYEMQGFTVNADSQTTEPYFVRGASGFACRNAG